MGLLKKLASDTALYGASSIIGRFLNYLLVPLYTSVFVPGEYGIVTEFYAYIAFLNILYVMGLETAYFRFSTKGEGNEAAIFNQSQTVVILATLIFSGSLIFYSESIATILDYPGQGQLITWIAIILGVDAFAAIPFARLRLQNKPKYFVAVKLTNIGLNIGLNLFFILLVPSLVQNGSSLSFVNWIYFQQWGVEYVFISNLIANAMLLPLLFPVYKSLKPVISIERLKSLLAYSYPFVLSGLAGVTNEMLSRALLKHWLPDSFYGDQSNLAALGVFGACYKLAVFMTLAVQAFRYAAEPFFFSQAREKDSPVVFANVMKWFVIFGCLIYILVSINLDIIGWIFLRDKSYHEGLYIVPYLLLGGLFFGIYYNLSVWFKLTDKTIYGAVLSGAGAVITIVLNYLLIPKMGYYGSAIAALISYFAMAALSFFIGRRFYKVPYQVGRIMFYIVFAGFLVALNKTVYLHTDMSQVILRVLSLTLFIAVAYRLEK
ncbi:MAG: polysaccharide biosynthesis C-terminal domain-containing protein [Cyclobacteriaceae bacterium]